MNGETLYEVLSSGVSAKVLKDLDDRITALEEAEEAKKTKTTAKKERSDE